jgi:hypothetical protein
LTDGKTAESCHTAASTIERGLTIDASTTTLTPAWIVCAWPTLLWQANRAPQLHLAHLGTHVLTFGDAESPCSGQTLWGEASAERSAGVAWDWVEIRDGVVAMADPLGLVTNLKLLDAQGEALPQLETAIRLHQLVYTLPWQTEVKRALHPHDA